MKKPSAAQQKYWDSKLKLYGLTEDAGTKDWLVYGHDVAKVDFDGRRAYAGISGESLDSEEWPLSLT